LHYLHIAQNLHMIENVSKSLMKTFCHKIELDDKIQKNIGNELNLISQLKQSILQEAIQGKLTADWRAKNSPPLEGWQTQSDGVVNQPPLEGWQTQSDGVVNQPPPEEWSNTGVVKRNSKNYFSLPYNPKLKQRAKNLRKAGNLAEVLFWKEVRNKQFKGLDFDRQKIIGNYIVDFYCPNCQAVIEIDGSSHDNKQEYDAKRDTFLQELGLTVIHIGDLDIKKNLAKTMNWLFEHPALELPSAEGGKEPPRPADTPPKEGNWEPATELLKRIKAEKAQLIKDKKIKKEKPLPPITKEEIPFDLPEGWVWAKLGDLCSKTGSGSTPRGGKSAYKELGIKFIRSQNVYDDGLRLNGVAFIPQATHEKMKGTKVQAEDLLLNITGGSIGRCCIVSKDFDTGNINQHVAIIRSVISENGYYLHKIICSPYFQHMIFEVQTGAGREGLPKNKMDNILIPFPPLEEQKAIVEKVEALMQKCQALEQEIKSSEANAKMLMQAVLKEAFESK